MTDPRRQDGLSPGIPKKGEQTMLVKAKWNVKDANGWHDAGEVFNTNDDLGDAVERLEAKKAVKAPEKEPEQQAEAESEPKPRSTSRRKKAAE